MILWRDAMSVGAPALDADHKRLIDLVNLTEQWIEQENWQQVGSITGELLAYVKDHFSREEAVQAAIKFPEAEAHKKLHEALALKARVLSDKFKAATTQDELKSCAVVMAKVLGDWLVTHILKEDMRFKPFIPKKAPPPAAAAAVEIKTGAPPAESEDERKARWEKRHRDIEYNLPPNLAHLLKHIEYEIPKLPYPERRFESFEKLCEGAICRRVDSVLVFFQRHNPSLKLELPPFFLASPEFADKFRQAIGKFIFPAIWESRQIRMLSTSFEWAEEDADSFWEHVTKPLQDCILLGWNQGWDDLKLIETRKDGAKVMQVKDNTKALREMLLPSSPTAYDLPRIGNREIETFRSLLDPANNWWERLNMAWKSCHDLYEQEKDPRVFQQKARDGALRDNLLNAFQRFPNEWVDFLVLACHRVFPRVSTLFLESFITNVGTNDAMREAYLPYTMRYLRQVREMPEIRARERAEEAEWDARVKELRDFIAGREKEEEKKT